MAEARELARHSDIRMTMRYAHIGLEDQAKAVGKLRYDSDLSGGDTAQGDSEKWQRYDSGTRHNDGHLGSSDGNDRHSPEPSDQKKNPSKNRGSDACRHNLSLQVMANLLAEDTGVEPATLAGN